MSFYIALLLGPFIASNLGMQGIFLITAVLALICVPVVMFGVPSANIMQASGDSLPKVSQLGDMLRHSYLWRLNVSVLVVHMLITCFFIQVPVQLVEIGIDLGDHWRLYSIVLLASVVCLFIMIKALDKQAVAISFRVSLLLMMAAFVLLLSAPPSWTGMLVAGILFFTGFNFLEAKMPSMVSAIAPAGRKGSAMGIYASHQFFGAFLGGILAGLLNSYFSAEYTFMMCLAVIVILNFIAKGLTSTERIKRVTLSIREQVDNQYEFNNEHISALRNKLSQLNGVKEAIIDLQDAAVYLKVDAKQFEQDQAEQIISLQAT